MSRKIHIFDTTLRDGEQTPGAKLNKRQKLEIAQQLAKLGVDIIEAGFPCSSPEDLQAVIAIARQVRGPIIAGLARTVKEDIDIAWEGVRDAERPRIHVFIGSSDIHVKKKLRRNRNEVLRMAIEAVQYTKSLCHDVEFSTEDGSRTDFVFLCRIIDATIRAGATVINVPDTVGYALPEEYGDLIRRLRESIPSLDQTLFSVHCHNDLGMAVANSLSAIRNGADQVECTINGVGERAGNASLEEIVMALKTRETTYRVSTGIVTSEIYRTSRMVSRLMNVIVQPNKAIVGSNAFSHSSGIHQDGVLKDRTTYEIMRPEDIGITQQQIVLTARSGRAALKHRLDELGFSLEPEIFQRVNNRFTDVADRKKEITNDDLLSIVEIETTSLPETYSLEFLNVSSVTGYPSQAEVSLLKAGELSIGKSSGNGQLEAAINVIDHITGVRGKIISFSSSGVGAGQDAQAESVLCVEFHGTIYTGIGLSTNTSEANVRAYLNALNRYLANGGEKKDGE
jgi:2-isopropylmalate synthase